MPPARRSARARPGPVRLHRPLTKAGVSGRRGRRGSAPTGKEGPAAVPPRSLHTGREGHKGHRGHSPTANQAGLAMSGSAQLHSRGTKKLTRRYYKEESPSNTRRVKKLHTQFTKKIKSMLFKKILTWHKLEEPAVAAVANFCLHNGCPAVFLFGEESGSKPPWIPTTSHNPNQPLATPEDSGHSEPPAAGQQCWNSWGPYATDIKIPCRRRKEVYSHYIC